MAKFKKATGEPRVIRPALTPESEEVQMIALATNLVKQRLLDGTASPMETTHYLKLATRETRLKNERLEQENKLIAAKTEAIESAKRVEELYANAIEAMKRYSGHGSSND